MLFSLYWLIYLCYRLDNRLDPSNRIGYLDLVGLLRAGLNLGLKLLRLLRTTSDEVTEELLNAPGLLDLRLEVLAEAGIAARALGALDDLRREGLELVIIINEVWNDVAEVGVSVVVHWTLIMDCYCGTVKD